MDAHHQLGFLSHSHFDDKRSLDYPVDSVERERQK